MSIHTLLLYSVGDQVLQVNREEEQKNYSSLLLSTWAVEIFHLFGRNTNSPIQKSHSPRPPSQVSYIGVLGLELRSE